MTLYSGSQLSIHAIDIVVVYYYYMSFYLSSTLSTPSPIHNRNDFVRTAVEQHLPIPDLARIISTYEGGYDTTTALKVFDKGMDLKGPSWDPIYTTEFISVASSTIITLGTLSQLTGEQHYQDTALDLSFNVVVVHDQECTFDPTAFGVHIKHSTTSKTQGCVSYNAIPHDNRQEETKQEWIVFVSLDPVIAPETWQYELVLPPLHDCKSSYYQVQAVYQYQTLPIRNTMSFHVAFGQPIFSLHQDKTSSTLDKATTAPKVVVYNALDDLLSLPGPRTHQPDRFVFDFPKQRFVSGTCIDLGTKMEIMKGRQADLLTILTTVTLVSIDANDVDVVIDHVAVSQVRILAYEQDKNPLQETGHQSMQDAYISKREEEHAMHFFSLIRPNTLMSGTTRFWLFLPPLMQKDLQYQVEFTQVFMYNQDQQPQETRSCTIPWRSSKS